MITIEFRESGGSWEEYKTYENEEELRQDINQFLYNSNGIEETYIYYSRDEEEKYIRSKVK